MSNPALNVTFDDVKKLVSHFMSRAYSVPSETPEAAEALSRCKALLELDYKVVEISNAGGVLCAHYPSRIFICEDELPHPDTVPMKNEALSFETESEVHQLRNQMLKARKGRCRARFPIPVILFKGKNICRSGTTAHPYEIYGRAAVETLNNYITGTSEVEFDGRDDDSSFNDDIGLETSVRNHDIQLLRMYDVNTIFDLMVEHKKVKYGMYVTSSEKADTENRYSDFNIVNIPYPGCEFFNSFYRTGKQGQNLFFDWDQKMVDKTLTVPANNDLDMNVDWKQYRSWDVSKLTMNYLALIIRHIQRSNSGVLIHCISGWDRTPLFISMVRLSLWADGLIHQSLSMYQMMYFTIAYDWMLFGHNFPNRLAKFEEIFFFCFYMLNHICDPICSIKSFYSGTDDNTPRGTPTRDDMTTNNGNMEFMDEELTKSDVSVASVSSTISNFSQGLNREIETEGEMNMETDAPKSGNNDFSDVGDICNDANILLEHDITPPMINDDSDIADTSNESNGNIEDAMAESSQQQDGVSSARAVGKSSPVPMLRINGNTDPDSSNGSWQMVSHGSSVGSQDLALKKRLPERFQKLTDMRREFFKVYYQSFEVPYKGGSTAFFQTMGNLAELVGLQAAQPQ